jgi:DNA repair exonuclease SbcCD ATPase subunit
MDERYQGQRHHHEYSSPERVWTGGPAFSPNRALDRTLRETEATRQKNAALSRTWAAEKSSKKVAAAEAKELKTRLDREKRRHAEDEWAYSDKVRQIDQDLATASSECNRLQNVVRELENQCSNMAFENQQNQRAVQSTNSERDQLLGQLVRYVEHIKEETYRAQQHVGALDSALEAESHENAVLQRALQLQ